MLSKTKPRFIQRLENYRNKIFSKTGGWLISKGVFSHGYSMLDELVGEKSYFQIMILNATGKLVDRRLADWAEAVYGCLSWPDARIWCNQIGAFAGSARVSAVAATSIGVMATDSRAYGVLPIVESAEFIQRAYRCYQQGAAVNDIIQQQQIINGKPHIMGYIRPIAKGDERIATMMKVARQLAFTEGGHLRLAFEIEQLMSQDYDEKMNINGYVAAFLSDLHFSPQEIYHISSMAVASGVTACYLDSVKRPSCDFLPLRCDDIEYCGKTARKIPKNRYTP